MRRGRQLKLESKMRDDMIRSEEGRLDTFLAKLRRRLLSK